MSTENKEIVRKVNSAFDENNMDAVLEQCTDNIKWVMVGNASVEGKEEIRKWMASGNENGNCLSQINSARLVAEGDTVACYGDMTLKDKEGNPLIYEYCDVYAFENGKISEIRSYVIKSH